MSDQELNYSLLRLYMTEISENEKVLQQFPQLAETIDRIAVEMHDIVKGMQLHLTGEKSLPNPVKYEQHALTALLHAVAPPIS